PEPQNTPSLRLKGRHASSIILIFCMLPAIGFDDQAVLDACEINNDRIDRILAPELESLEAPIAQCKPQPPLGIGLVLSKLARSLVRHRHPHPAPGTPGASLSRVRERECYAVA